MHPITKKIKIAAIEKGLKTNLEIANWLGYKPNYVSTLINGHTGFPLGFLSEVANKLDLDLNELIKMKDEKYE